MEHLTDQGTKPRVEGLLYRFEAKRWMTAFTRITSIILVVGLVVPARADVVNNNDTSQPADSTGATSANSDRASSDSSKQGPYQSRFSIFAGPSLMATNEASDTGVFMGLDMKLVDAGAAGVYSLEAGGTLPQTVKYGFGQQLVATYQNGYGYNPVIYDKDAYVTTFSEVELDLKGEWVIDPVGKYTAFEAGFGVSRAKIHDHFEENEVGTILPIQTSDQTVTTISPLVLIGLHFFPTSPNFSIRMDLGYVRWVNDMNVPPATYNISLSTVFFRPMLQLRF